MIGVPSAEFLAQIDEMRFHRFFPGVDIRAGNRVIDSQ